jgi:hypothetical protein
MPWLDVEVPDWDQVDAAGFLAEHREYRVAGSSKGKDDRKGRAIADILRVFHVVKIAYRPDGTMPVAPE